MYSLIPMEDISQQPSAGNNWLLPATAHDQVFARRLRALREVAQLTQRQLADQMTVAGYRMHQTTIAKIEAGDRPVVIGEAVCFASIIGVDLADLVKEPVPVEPVDDAELAKAMELLASCEQKAVEAQVRVERAQRVEHAARDELARAHMECGRAAARLEGLRYRQEAAGKGVSR